MAQLTVYSIDGKKTGTVAVSDAVFACPSNPALVQQVAVAYAANRRQSTAHTKDRSERSGSGRKPWKQKGTGRARVGSTRTPIWRKGGVVFGPRNTRNFAQQIPLKMRRKALAVVLSEKLRAEHIIVVDRFALPEIKTKHMADALHALDVATKSCVIALARSEREIARAGRNIPSVLHRALSTLNAYDLLNATVLVISTEALKELESRLAGAIVEDTNA